MKKLLRIVGLVVVVGVVGVGAFALYKIGPRNAWGMLRYDQRRDGDLKVGDRAPDVVLTALDGATQVRLREKLGGRPAVLVFGSFTWPPFRRSVERLEAMHRRYGDRVEFLTVYIKEAHPEDEWQMDDNEKEDVCYPQPKTLAQRVAIANDFVRRFEYPLPLLVDGLDNAADRAYAGWPERFYVIEADGTIVYKGEPGPFGFHPEEVEEWLARRFAA